MTDPTPAPDLHAALRALVESWRAESMRSQFGDHGLTRCGRELTALFDAHPVTERKATRVVTRRDLADMPVASIIVGPAWNDELYKKWDANTWFAIAQDIPWTDKSLEARGPFVVLRYGEETPAGGNSGSAETPCGAADRSEVPAAPPVGPAPAPREAVEREALAKACMRGSVLTEVIAEALTRAEEAGMTGRTVAEWVSIEVIGSDRVPLAHHFPAEGGGPCSTCGRDYLAVPQVRRVHDHGPWRPMCNERDVLGQLRGACLNDDGTSRTPAPQEGGNENGSET